MKNFSIQNTVATLFLCFIIIGTIQAQNNSAIVDFESTEKGILIPRMQSVQRIAIINPADGLLVYDTDINAFLFFNGTTWVKINDNLLVNENGNNNTLYNIEDNTPLDAESSIILNEEGIIDENTYIEVCLDLDYDYLREIETYLLASDGTTQITLSDGTGTTTGMGSYANACFTTTSVNPISVVTPFSGLYMPTESFSMLNGQNINGSWKLIASDNNLGNGDTGTLNNWSISFKKGDIFTSLEDTDKDTKVEVEASEDSDKIDFIIEGKALMTLDKNASDELLINIGESNGNNIFIGSESGQNNIVNPTTGRNNTMIGYNAGKLQNDGIGNTYLGYLSGEKTTNGSQNTYLGAESGLNNINGSSNIFIGNQAGYNEMGNQKLYIESSASNSSNTLIYGEFDTDSLLLNANVQIRDTLHLSPDGLQMSDGSHISSGPKMKYYIATEGVFPSSTGGISNDVYIGEIRLFPYLNTNPAGWAACEGQLLSISGNSALFSLLGTKFGGNGTTTFALPDMRDAIPHHK